MIGGGRNQPAAPIVHPATHYFELLGSEPARNTARNTEQIRFAVRFKNVDDCERPDQLLEMVLNAIFERLLEGRPPAKLIGLSLQPDDFQQPYNIPLRDPQQNTPAVIAAAILDFQRRYPTLGLFNGGCQIKVNIVWPLNPAAAVAGNADDEAGPSGACSLLPAEDDSQAAADHTQMAPRRCQSLWTVVNPMDRWCLPRSVYMGAVFHALLPVPVEILAAGGQHVATAPHVPRRFLQQQQLHTPYVRDMMEEAGLAMDLQFYGLTEAAILQAWMTQRFGLDRVRLIILSYEHQYRMIYRGVDHPTHINLCVFIQQKHFAFVGRPEQLFNVKLIIYYKID
jgi:hypothetical protein